MLDASHLLARLFGIVFIIFYGGILLNFNFYKYLWRDFPKQPFFLLISGFMALVSGSLVVLFHPEWTPNWESLITLLGWIMIIQGIIRIVFPEHVLKFIENLSNDKGSKFLVIGSFVMLLLGLYLTLMSYH